MALGLLQGAFELRNGVPSSGGIDTASPDTILAMPPAMLFDYRGVRLNGPRAAGKKIALNVQFTDLGERYALVIEDGVLNYSTKPLDKPDASLVLTKATLDSIQLGDATADQLIQKGDLKLTGSRPAFDEFFGLLDKYPFWFPIVTP